MLEVGPYFLQGGSISVDLLPPTRLAKTKNLEGCRCPRSLLQTTSILLAITPDQGKVAAPPYPLPGQPHTKHSEMCIF